MSESGEVSDLKEELRRVEICFTGDYGKEYPGVDIEYSRLKRLATLAQDINVSKGFNSDADLIARLRQQAAFNPDCNEAKAATRLEELNLAVQISLVADEAFEALAEHRKRNPDDKLFDELGDVLIRVLGIFGKHQRDPGEVIFRILSRNLDREFKHGNRRY